MKTFRFQLACCLLIMINHISFSQTKYLRNNFWIENYTKKDGLPESFITGITQDRKGFLWIATLYKLVRFDGYQFEVFDPRKDFPESFLIFNEFILDDDNGKLWMGTDVAGLVAFDPITEKFSRLTAENSGLTNDEISGLSKDNEGNIWAATPTGLNRVFERDGKMQIEAYRSQYSDTLLNLIDTIVAHNTPIVNFSKTGNFQQREQTIHLTERTELLVICMGEARDRIEPTYDTFSDYGGIENDKGFEVWSFDPLKWFSAGGATKNRLQIDVVTLQAGVYKIWYRSNGTHSWNTWNNLPPNRKEYWGIQLFVLPRSVNEPIQAMISEALKSKAIIGSNVVNLLRDSHGIFWALTTAGLEKLTYDSGKVRNEVVKFPKNFTPTSYVERRDKSHLLVLGDIYDSMQRKKLFAMLTYDHENNRLAISTQRQFLPSTTQGVHQFLDDKRNHLWIATFNDHGRGIYLSDDGGRKFHPMDIRPPGDRREFEELWSLLYQDRQGYIWVGSQHQGLYKIDPNPPPITYVNVSRQQKDTSQAVFSEVFADNHDGIWLANAKGIVRYDHSTKTSTYFPASNRDEIGPLFISGPDNSVFVSEAGQLREYDRIRNKLIPARLRIPDSLKLIGFDSFGNAWCRHLEKWASRFYISNGRQFVPAIFDSTIFRAGFYRDFHLGRNGHVWISPAFNGIEQYEVDNKTKSLTFVNRYLSNSVVDVFDIYEQPDGIVWMATYEGLISLDPSTYTHRIFTKKDGLPSDWTGKLVPLKDKLWIITELGSGIVTTKDGTIMSPREADEFINLNTPGYFDRPPIFYDWAAETKNEEIAIVGNGGFFLFRKEAFLADSVRPLLQLTRLSVNGIAINSETVRNRVAELSLSHDQNDFEIEFVGIHFKRPSQNQYSYLLKGGNENWVFTDHERVARFSNLSPGHYEFYLKASNSDGIWSEEQKMFSFTILPPWWQTWWAYASYTLIGFTGIWAYVSYRSRALKKENVLLEEKVTQRTDQLNQSLENLKAAQTQLIHSEKMASLGELTAGIAHEIQNPLNFINNFSEVNMELLDEMRTALSNGDNASAISISKDVSANEEKINHHGGRADGIVKGMLQHSRSTRGIKEPSDLNALADEYLRLSYHGMRAKDKSFNVALKTDFDKNLAAVNIISQDIGRVLLNLFNNSFYSVVEKRKVSINGYEPEVRVSTKKIRDKVEVCVRDNGLGISRQTLDKIFQPFFTTKPPGQGTGLGLSISYDMIVAHGGELKVDTKEGEYAEFIIVLPI